MQDYGAPVGFRMVLTHPERVEALLVKDAVAHNEGLSSETYSRKGPSQLTEFSEVRMVSRAGLEPATTALKVRCSTN